MKAQPEQKQATILSGILEGRTAKVVSEGPGWCTLSLPGFVAVLSPEDVEIMEVESVQ